MRLGYRISVILKLLELLHMVLAVGAADFVIPNTVVFIFFCTELSISRNNVSFTSFYSVYMVLCSWTQGAENNNEVLVMVALCNRADHYIFILFLLSFFLLA